MVLQLIEAAPAGLVGWNRIVPAPRAAGVLIEVLAWADGGVDSLEVDAGGGWRVGCTGRGRGGSDRDGYEEKAPKRVHGLDSIADFKLSPETAAVRLEMEVTGILRRANEFPAVLVELPIA
jgi:hypothetical protein